MLENLCEDMLNKNVNLNLKHEQMMDEEKTERSKIAEGF
jgi:hypothetical protein